MATGVTLIGQVTAPWQLYPCFVLLGIGWSTLSMTGITTTVAPWFERHQGRSMTLAIMGASVGAIAGVPLLLLAIGELGPRARADRRPASPPRCCWPLIARRPALRGPADLGLQRDGDAPRGDGRGPSTHLAADRHAANRRLLLWSATAAFALGLTDADRLHHPSCRAGRAAAGHGGGGLARQRHGRHGVHRPPDPGAHRRSA